MAKRKPTQIGKSSSRVRRSSTVDSLDKSYTSLHRLSEGHHLRMKLGDPQVQKIFNRRYRSKIRDLETLREEIRGFLINVKRNKKELTFIEKSLGIPKELIPNVFFALDPDMRAEGLRVAQLSGVLAKELRLSEFDQKAIVVGSLLSDVGKILMLRDIKKTTIYAPKSPAMNRIKCHPLIGATIIFYFFREKFEAYKSNKRENGVNWRKVYPKLFPAETGEAEMKRFADAVSQVVQFHHERLDGGESTGKIYFGLKGDKVPFNAQVSAVADIDDAVMIKRAHDPARGQSTLVSELRTMETNKELHSRILATNIHLIRAQELGLGTGILDYKRANKATGAFLLQSGVLKALPKKKS